MRPALPNALNNSGFALAPLPGITSTTYHSEAFGGLKAHHTWKHELFGRDMEDTVGLEVRGDRIENGLNATERRQYLSTTRAARPDRG